jgi:hypothetical protein
MPTPIPPETVQQLRDLSAAFSTVDQLLDALENVESIAGLDNIGDHTELRVWLAGFDAGVASRIPPGIRRRIVIYKDGAIGSCATDEETVKYQDLSYLRKGWAYIEEEPSR